MKPSDITNEWVEQNFDVEKERKNNKEKNFSRIVTIDSEYLIMSGFGYFEDDIIDLQFINKDLIKERIELTKRALQRDKELFEYHKKATISSSTGIAYDVDKSPCWDEDDIEIKLKEKVFYKETYSEARARVRRREREKLKKKQSQVSHYERLLKEQEKIQKELNKIEGEK